MAKREDPYIAHVIDGQLVTFNKLNGHLEAEDPDVLTMERLLQEHVRADVQAKAWADIKAGIDARILYLFGLAGLEGLTAGIGKVRRLVNVNEYLAGGPGISAFHEIAGAYMAEEDQGSFLAGLLAECVQSFSVPAVRDYLGAHGIKPDVIDSAIQRTETPYVRVWPAAENAR